MKTTSLKKELPLMMGRHYSRCSTRDKTCCLARLCYGVIAIVLYCALATINNNSNNDSNLRASVKSVDKNSDCDALNVLSPAEISQLKRLNLSGCNIESIPESIKYATSLELLDVGNNPSLTTLPEELKSCTKLDILFASSCKGIKSLPTVLGQMKSITRLGWRSGSLTALDPNGLPPNLVHLILTDNSIKKIDKEEVFNKLQNVRKLMLSHNNIARFGDSKGSIKKLRNLELLRIAGNQLTSISDELWTLPNLTWLTISGNPFMDELKVVSKVPWIKENELKSTGHFLGEGASGKVTSYEWKDESVAVKLIHGVTSDGRAEDELKVYGAVGRDGMEHRVVGSVALLQGDKKGAVMQKLPDNLDDLALPPTIVEVTQDRWDNWDKGTHFSKEFVMNVLTDVATALKYLHEDVGVAHGDVYAHNMKVDRHTGRVYLLDFGASYFTGEYAEKAEKLEVRAYGVLIQEMMSKIDVDLEDSSFVKVLEYLRAKCQNEDVHGRPKFADIYKTLQSI